jgi:L-malate glycosyltransferase
MRIAQFIDTAGEGGAERVLIDLCRHLRSRGHEVVALHFGSEHLRRECRRYGLDEREVPGWTYYKKTATLPRFAWGFRAFLRAQGIDVLHSHLFGPVTGAAPAARLAGIPHVGTLHDIYSVAEKPQRVRLVQLAALLGTRLIAVSRNMEGFYRTRARFPAGSLRTIYNGVHVAPPPARREALRAALGIGADELVVICVGRLVPLKRHDLLLQAFAGLEFPARLVIVGDGPLRETLEREAAASAAASRISFLGSRSDVPELLGMSDVFALASDTEGLSCSVLEAMAAGLPSVVTEVGGNSELVSDGESGFLAPPGDADVLRERLAVLLGDAPLRARLGEAARTRASTCFSMAANLQRYLQLYRGERGE